MNDRKEILKVIAEYKTSNNKRFFLSEGQVYPIEQHFLEPLENFDEDERYDKISQIKSRVAQTALDLNLDNFEISEIDQINGIEYFKLTINDNSYILFLYDHNLYYRNSIEFLSICDEINIGNQPLEMLIYKDNKQLSYVNADDTDACNDLIDTLFVCNENSKIIEPPLGCDGDKEQSKLYHDALYGDKERNDFEEKVERETQQAGVDNPLAPTAQQESVQFSMFPNQHSLQESKTELTDMKIEYEPYDWVVIKENDMKAQVTNICHDGDGNISLLTILASNGIQYDVEDLNEIMPDPLYLENIPGRVINSQNLVVPRLAEFDIDPETRLVRQPQNEELPVDYHKDLNDNKTVLVYVLSDGRRVTAAPLQASLEDVKESKKEIRVMNESGEFELHNVKDLEFEELPSAEVVNSDGKSIKTVQVDPTSFINADENELVICIEDDQQLRMPKSRVVISL